ncbi:MAG: hypothetical protein ACTSPY_17010 [Candidatus Helarchaeota archaeon]
MSNFKGRIQKVIIIMIIISTVIPIPLLPRAMSPNNVGEIPEENDGSVDLVSRYNYETYNATGPYIEELNVLLDRDGNLTISGVLNGTFLDFGLDLAIPEYKGKYLIYLHVSREQNSYNLFNYYNLSNVDYYLVIVTQSIINQKLVLDHCKAITADFQAAFGLPEFEYIGKLPLRNKGVFPYEGAIYEADLMSYFYGNNFTGIVDFDYFVNIFENEAPIGLGDIFTQQNINASSEAQLGWLINKNPGNDFQKQLIINLNYDNQFNFSAEDNYTMDVLNILQLSSINSTYTGFTHEIDSKINIYLANSRVENYSYQGSEFVKFTSPSKLEYKLLDYEPYWRGLKQLDELVINFSNPIGNIELISPQNTIDNATYLRADFSNPYNVDLLKLNIWNPDEYWINKRPGMFRDYFLPQKSYKMTNAWEISNLNKDFDSIYDYDVCTDTLGNIHVVYTKNISTEGDMEVFYQKFDGKKWETIRITNDSINQVHVSIATDSLNNVHIAFEEIQTLYEIMYVNNTNGMFGVPISISQNPLNDDIFPKLISSGTTIYAIWGNYSTINYRGIFLGGTLGPIKNITNLNSQSLSLDAVIDTSMVLHLLALNYTSYEIYYFNHSITTGNSSEMVLIYNYSFLKFEVFYLDIEIDGNDNLHIIYSGENDDLQYFNISSTGVWSSKNNLTDDGNKSQDFGCSIAIGANNNVYISYIKKDESLKSYVINLSSGIKKEKYLSKEFIPNASKLVYINNDYYIFTLANISMSGMPYDGILLQMMNDTWFSENYYKEYLYSLSNGKYLFELELITDKYPQSIIKEIEINNTNRLSAEIVDPIEDYRSNSHFETINITVNITSGPVNITNVSVYAFTWLQQSYLIGVRRFVSNWSIYNNSNQKAPITYRFNWSTNGLFQTGNYTLVIVIEDINNVSLIIERNIYILANGLGINDPKDGDTISGVKTLDLNAYIGAGCNLFGAGFPLIGQFLVSVLRSDSLDSLIVESYQEVLITGITMIGTLQGDLISSDLENGEYILLPSVAFTDGVNYIFMDFWQNITIINISNPTPIIVNPGSDWSNINDVFVLNFTISGSSNTGPEYTPSLSYLIHSPDKYISVLHQYAMSTMYIGIPGALGDYTAIHYGVLVWNATKSIWEINRTSAFTPTNNSGWATYNVEDKDYLLSIIRYTNNTYWGSLGAMGNFELISPDTYLTTNNQEKLICKILSPVLNDTIENTIIVNVTFTSPYGHEIDQDYVQAFVYINNGSQLNRTLIAFDYLWYNPLTDTYNGIISIGNRSNKYLQLEIYGRIGEEDFKQVGIFNDTFIRSQYSPDGTPPSAPSSFNATALTDGSIFLEWTNSTSIDVNRYILLRNSTEKDPYILEILPASQLNYTDTQVSEGVEYRYWLIAMDNNSLYSSRINVSEISDMTPPSISLITPIHLNYYNNRLSINATIIEVSHEVDTVFAKLWNSSWNSDPIILINLSKTFYMNDTILTFNYNDGLYNLTIFANDTVGNLNTHLISIYFDNSVPVIQEIYSPIENRVYYPNLTITALITDLVGVDKSWAYITNATNYNTTVILNRIGSTDVWTGVWENITGQIYYDGAYNISILANDTLGNGIIQSLNRTFFIDSNIPYIHEPLYSPENAHFYRDQVLINVSATDPNGISKVWCQISNGSGTIENITLIDMGNDTFTNNWSTLGTINDGSYELVVFANDTTSSIAQSSTYIVFIDNTNPTSVMISRVKDNWTNPHDSLLNNTEFRNEITIFASFYEENIYSVEFYNNSNLLGINFTANANSGTWKWNTNSLNGQQNLTIRVNDTAGNSVTSTAVFTINLDNTDPTGVLINNIIDNYGHNYTQGDLYFNGTITFICQFGSEQYPNNATLYDLYGNLLSSTTLFNGVNFNITWDSTSFNGKKQFYVKLNDTTDHFNTSSTFPNTSITIDNTKPVISNIEILDNHGHMYSNGDRNFYDLLTVRASWIETNPSLIEFYMGTTLIGLISNPSNGFSQVIDYDTSSMADNSYNIRIILTDSVGSSSTGTRQITIDNNDPISIGTTPDIVSGNQISISGVSIDGNGSGIVLAQIIAGNGSSYFSNVATATTGIWTFNNISHISDAIYMISVKAWDDIGHSSTTWIKFRVDNTAPSSPTNFDYDLTQNTVNLTWDYSVDSDIKYYRIYRNNKLISTVDANVKSYLDGPLIAGIYNYSLVAVDEAGLESDATFIAQLLIPAPSDGGLLDFTSLLIGLIIGLAIMIPIALLLSRKKKKEKKPEKKTTIPSKKITADRDSAVKPIPITEEKRTIVKEIKPFPIPKQYVCQNCGADIPPGGNICVKCGSNLIKEKEQ